MNITEARYASDGMIDAIIDGEPVRVPDVGGNRHREALREWEAGGGEIEPYVEPAPPAPRSTAMWRARAIARITPAGSGTLFDAIENALDNLPDPAAAAVAREAWDRGTVFDLDGQTVPMLMDALGMSEADVLPLIAAAEQLPA